MPVILLGFPAFIRKANQSFELENVEAWLLGVSKKQTEIQLHFIGNDTLSSVSPILMLESQYTRQKISNTVYYLSTELLTLLFRQASKVGSFSQKHNN
ncbi:MAG: hypothetical protein V3V22_02460 [Methylococcales bacterium]